MLLNRKLEIGERVVVKTRAEIDEFPVDIDGYHRYMPEAAGRGLNFAQAMYAYCGRVFEVCKLVQDFPRRVKLMDVETGEIVPSWVWCPSMLDDYEEDPPQAPEESPVGFLLGL